MCGITASYVTSAEVTPDPATLEAQLRASIRTLQYRGPDASGIYISDDGRVGLGHARLSIIDLEGGNQPLHDLEGDVHAVVNGELYDYAILRQQLEAQGRVFQTFSDSELVIHLYKIHGLNLVQFLRGEFAFVLYDSRRKLLFAVRDRLGVKPLFYTLSHGKLLIASEIKAFMDFGWKAEWDVQSILETGELNDNRTVFKGVYKLSPAHHLLFTRMGQLKVQPYWNHNFRDRNLPETRSVDELIQGVRERMIDAVRARLRSDVPLAVSLSGGLDSASIAGIASALLREKNPKAKVVTFTLAFPERGDVDEGPVAQRQAEFIGADCHMVTPSEGDLLAKFDDVVYHSEEPVHTMHAAGKMVLNETIRKEGYKVCLTGEGSDENQGGYAFLLADFLRAPDPASLSLGFPIPTAAEIQNCLELRQKMPLPQDHVAIDDFSTTDHKLGRAMLGGISTVRVWATLGLPLKLVHPKVAKELWNDDRSMVIAEGFRPESRAQMINGSWHPLHCALYTVSTIMLPMLLNQVGDRPELANSIEGRQPFTDHKLIEYMNTIPPSLKIMPQKTSDGQWTFIEKWILRQAVKPFVTDEIYQRRKAQYNAPIPPTKMNGDASGVKPLTPLQAYLKERVTEERVNKLGFLDWGNIDALLADYIRDPQTPKDGGLDKRARVLLSISSYTVLQEKFKVPTAVF